jgi:hypothetical protein
MFPKDACLPFGSPHYKGYGLHLRVGDLGVLSRPQGDGHLELTTGLAFADLIAPWRNSKDCCAIPRLHDGSKDKLPVSVEYKI